MIPVIHSEECDGGKYRNGMGSCARMRRSRVKGSQLTRPPSNSHANANLERGWRHDGHRPLRQTYRRSRPGRLRDQTSRPFNDPIAASWLGLHSTIPPKHHLIRSIRNFSPPVGGVRFLRCERPTRKPGPCSCKSVMSPVNELSMRMSFVHPKRLGMRRHEKTPYEDAWVKPVLHTKSEQLQDLENSCNE